MPKAEFCSVVLTFLGTYGASLGLPILPPIYPSISEEAAFQIRSWVNTCTSTHLCGPAPHIVPPLARLPKRLLELGKKQGDVRLVELSSLLPHLPPYVTLSYCWGQDPTRQLRTNLANLDAHMTSIVWLSIPPLVQNAMLFTKVIGASYIWVDALCIVQDSRDDSKAEIPKMGSIYAHSWFTIAATKSTGVDEAFLTADEASNFNVKLINDWFPFSNGREAFILHSTIERTKNVPTIEDSPWNKRAWTYQERLFSPRIVHFASDQLYWECQKGIECQDGLVTWDVPNHSRNRSVMHLDWRDRDVTPGQEAGGQGKDNIVDNWYRDISEDYSGRSLGRATDKLPAISALARDIASYIHDGYVAGHWLHSLDTSLSWTRENQEAGTVGGFGRIGDALKSLDNGCPSWSWASRQGQVWWSGWASLRRMPFASTEEEIMRSNLAGEIAELRPRKQRGVVQFKDWKVVFQGSDPFGAVQEARLMLKGRVKSAFVQSTYKAGCGYLLDESAQPLGTCCFDGYDVPEKVDVLFLLEQDSEGSRERALGLLLRENEGIAAFERIGLAATLELEWFDDAVERDITLL
jgi:hypothetical protein